MHTFDVRCLELRFTVFKRLHWGSCKDGPCLFWVPSSKVWKPRVCFMFHTAGNRTPEFLLNGVSNVCPLGFGRRCWGGHEKEIAVGLLKMADGNEDVDFGVVLERGEKITFWIFNDFPTAAALLMGLLVHPQQRLSQMPKVHLWSHSESLNGHWRKAMLCVGLWLEKKNSWGRSC